MSQPLQPAAAAAFATIAPAYDAQRRALVPGFDAFYGHVLERLDAWGGPDRPRVLDLGAGTGLLAALVAGRRPMAELVLLDGSEPMLALARQRLGSRPGVGYRTADLASAELGGPFDLIVSALAIHHLEHPAKRDLFARIHDALVPGGLFVNAEQVLGPTPAGEALYHAVWRQQAQALGAAEADIAAAEERMRHDRCATVEDQLAWLRAAGFPDADCTFKRWRFAVLGGTRPRP